MRVAGKKVDITIVPKLTIIYFLFFSMQKLKILIQTHREMSIHSSNKSVMYFHFRWSDLQKVKLMVQYNIS